MMVLVGHEQGQQEYTLQSLSDVCLQDLLGHSDNIDCAPDDHHDDGAGSSAGRTCSVVDSFHFDDDVLLGPAAPRHWRLLIRGCRVARSASISI